MFRKAAIIIGLALVGWALCGATMGIGLALFALTTAQIIHAVAAPIFFAIITWLYYRYFGYTTPLQTAVLFLTVIIFMDIFVVSLLIIGSFEMFASVLGTWIPVALIFSATYLTGRAATESSGAVSP